MFVLNFFSCSSNIIPGLNYLYVHIKDLVYPEDTGGYKMTLNRRRKRKIVKNIFLGFFLLIVVHFSNYYNELCNQGSKIGINDYITPESFFAQKYLFETIIAKLEMG